MNEKAISMIERLIAVCKDGEVGFQLASNEINASVLQSLFRGYSLQRSCFARDLQAAASALGKSVPIGGGVGNAVHHTWMKAGEVAAPRDEQTVLSECERGDSAVIAAYAPALDESELPPAIRTLIAAQAVDVREAHNELRTLCNRFVPAK